MRTVRRKPVLQHDQRQMRMLSAHIRNQTPRRVALAIVLAGPIRLPDRLRRKREHLPMLRMHHHRRKQLVVILRAPVPAMLLAALRAVHRTRRERPRAVHRQQVVPLPVRIPLQPLASLQLTEYTLEGLPQASRVQTVQSLAKPGIRGSLANAEQAAQIRTDRVVAPHLPVKLQQGRKLQRKQRKPGHQVIRQTILATPHIVRDLLKTVPNLLQQTRFAQMLAKRRLPA